MWLLGIAVVALIFLYRWNRQRQMLQNLTDKYVLITGCDSGFGNLLAKQLDKRGMQVLATCFTEKGAEDLKKGTSSRLQTNILDVTNSQNVKSVAKWVTETVGNKGLWGLVNNSGCGGPFSPNAWQRKKDFAQVLEVNLLGMVDVTLNLLPMLQKAKGRIVNVSSAGGRLAIVGGGYCMSKYGVEAFSDSLRREMYHFGVKVMIIEPGAFKTAMSDANIYKERIERLWKNLPSETKETYGEKYFSQYVQLLEGLIKTADSRLNKVTDCMEHALTAAFPWTRYSPGWDCKLYFLPVSYLPTVMSDYLFCRSAPKPACTSL
ncbi:hypothetical protein GDO86_004317 [Hymenochirus boettgeri]|uniref:Retinol dehydrogenase 7 n=1 Tax=Hymenochirus boettgeri TaxID=247094 RepID=A0A8T2K5D8_9PIPI|nr:hypothetical protein GDO86_004317 [Hymenochirus boettgeri]